MTRLETLATLMRVIEERRGSDAGASYTKSLLEAGPERCAKKFGEEAVEAVIAAVSGDREALKTETADVLYHLLVLLSASNVALEEVLIELEGRMGLSGHEEKRARSTEG